MVSLYLHKVKSKNATSYYVAKTIYDENGKKSSKIVEKLGTYEELSKIYDNPIEYAKNRVKELTEQEKNQTREVVVKYSQSRVIEMNSQTKYNCGYLFLQKIYHELKLDEISEDISKKYKFEYDLDSILSRLVYGRILFPASKLSTAELSKNLLEQPKFELHQVYRALEILAKSNDYIQAELYKNSSAVLPRNTGILYYDCTNYFFEIEEESNIRKYGVSKEHRPNPIVQMGLFMDGNGIPLAFCINPGNTNEQNTLLPLEKKIIKDFGQSKIIVCTDAGLSSTVNRKFNDIQNRAFITVQSIKKMKDYQKEWALSEYGWKLNGQTKEYTMAEILENRSENYNKVFYKEAWYNDNDIEQRYIVTFSIKYKEYMQKLREKHIQRAQKLVDTGAVRKNRSTDPKRLIGQMYITDSGEIAEDVYTFVDSEKIANEAAYDGLYCVATNLEDSASEILKVNSRRREIEESFRIMKSSFKARPVYLQREDRIRAHFITCFLALTIFRILEKKLDEEYTSDTLIRTLREMELCRVDGEGYVPIYTRNSVTDKLHDTFGFRTDYQLNTFNLLKNIFKETKK